VILCGEGAVQAHPAASVRVFAVLRGDHMNVWIREVVARECCGAEAFVPVRDPDHPLGLLVGLCDQVEQQRQDRHPAVGPGATDRLVELLDQALTGHATRPQSSSTGMDGIGTLLGSIRRHLYGHAVIVAADSSGQQRPLPLWRVADGMGLPEVQHPGLPRAAARSFTESRSAP
jgi:hypothetical protein